MTIQAEDLEDRVVYLMADDQPIKIGVWDRNRHIFLGVHHFGGTEQFELREVSPYEPERGHYGEVMPVESTGHEIDDWVQLALTVFQGVWEDNTALRDELVAIEEELGI